MRIAVLSNVNMDYITRLLKKHYEVWQPQGYGTLFEQLLDDSSSLNTFSPEVIAILPDIDSIITPYQNINEAKEQIDKWYQMIESALKSSIQYFVADALIHSEQILDLDEFYTEEIEQFNMECIQKLCQKHRNIHYMKLRNAISKEGKKQCYSKQLWYTGRIIFSNTGCKVVANVIQDVLYTMQYIPKKVLALDLDNTLWGGIVGECGPQGIELSEDKVGLIYKDVQRLIKQMKAHGVLLTIISKNNRADVEEVFKKNAHMVLKLEDFIETKINWESKADNLIQLAKDLNLGLDSFVFIDDMPVERENVKMILPMVEVPDFPNDLIQLPHFFETVYKTYFKKLKGTFEDISKTEQYKQNKERITLEKAMDYETFLKSLKIEVESVLIDNQVKERLFQLFQKTNQFNTTTIRYSRQQLEDKLQSKDDKIYLFRARDKFGDYGIIAAVVVTNLSTIPCIEDFVMSCRIMSKCVENYIINEIEKDLISMGKQLVQALYYKSHKNMPVEKLYENLGYQCIESSDIKCLYQFNLLETRERKYYVK